MSSMPLAREKANMLVAGLQLESRDTARFHNADGGQVGHKCVDRKRWNFISR